MKSRTTGSVVRLAAPLRALAQRFSFLLLVLAAIALMMVGKIDTVLVEGMRNRVTDAFAPILDAISRPAATAARFVESVHEVINLRSENERLRSENATLLRWQQAAQRLDAENRSLRSLLNYKPELASSYITARVVADPGGAFVRTVVVTAGYRDGVRPGQAAVAGQGLMGRVVQVGEWSSRVLLVTDLNSRIPVVIEPSRQRAVMAGDNSGQPRSCSTSPAMPRWRWATGRHVGQWQHVPAGIADRAGRQRQRQLDPDSAFRGTWPGRTPPTRQFRAAGRAGRQRSGDRRRRPSVIRYLVAGYLAISPGRLP